MLATGRSNKRQVICIIPVGGTLRIRGRSSYISLSISYRPAAAQPAGSAQSAIHCRKCDKWALTSISTFTPDGIERALVAAAPGSLPLHSRPVLPVTFVNPAVTAATAPQPHHTGFSPCGIMHSPSPCDHHMRAMNYPTATLSTSRHNYPKVRPPTPALPYCADYRAASDTLPRPARPPPHPPGSQLLTALCSVPHEDSTDFLAATVVQRAMNACQTPPGLTGTGSTKH
jgi:hypothetical protein